MINKFPALLAVLILGTTPVMACDLRISNAWIREAPPGLMVLAGYASLTNEGSRMLQVVKIESPAFGEIQMHETVIEQGVSSMRNILVLKIAAHQSAIFSPDGKHFMLMQPAKPLKQGDVVTLRFVDNGGCTTETGFVVRHSAE